MNIPPKSRFDFSPSIDHNHRAIGLVQATKFVLERIGYNYETEELLGISSLAFCNYVYNPDYNQHDDERRFHSEYSDLISNYGVFESLAHYTGADISELNAMSNDDIWRLIQFEILHERPLITMAPDFEVELIGGYQVTEEKRMIVTDGAEEEMRTPLQGDDPVFVNWTVMIREGDKERTRTPKVRQQTNLLNWVVKHGFSQKEFFQETRENYACGIHGLEVMSAWVEKCSDGEEFEVFSNYFARLLLKRRAAAFCLRLWSKGIAAATDPIVEELLNQAASEYEKMVEQFEGDEAWVEVFSATIEHERAALSYIRDASQYFPSAFG